MERIDEVEPREDLRRRAIRHLKKKRDFQAHLLVYTLVNTFLVVIWAVTGAHFFWPIFPIVGWGIGVVMNAWDVYRSEDPDEEQIRAEMERLKRREQHVA
jgi:2TM domain